MSLSSLFPGPGAVASYVQPRRELPARATSRSAWRLRCASAAAAESSDVTISGATQSGGGGGGGGGGECIRVLRVRRTALTPCAGGAGSGGGSGRHGDGEDSSLPPRDSSFWFSVESFVRRNPRRASAAAVATLGGVASFAFSRSEIGVAMKMCKVFEEGGVRGWEEHFRPLPAVDSVWLVFELVGRHQPRARHQDAR